MLKGRRKKHKTREDGGNQSSGDGEKKGVYYAGTLNPGKKFKMANPWACLGIFFWRDTALTLWMSSSPYGVWFCVQTSILFIYKDTYSFNKLTSSIPPLRRLSRHRS
jgi:hypothetical protein